MRQAGVVHAMTWIRIPIAFATIVAATSVRPQTENVDIVVTGRQPIHSGSIGILFAATNRGTKEISTLGVKCTALGKDGNPLEIGSAYLKYLKATERDFGNAHVDVQNPGSVASAVCKADMIYFKD
jgi:hypothetical protein